MRLLAATIFSFVTWLPMGVAAVDKTKKPEKRFLMMKMMGKGKTHFIVHVGCDRPPPAPKYHPCGGMTTDPVSPNGVVTLSPEGGIIPTATWSLGTRAGDFVYVAGMRGIDPEKNALVPDDLGRVRQAFLNMQLIAASEGASLYDATRLVVYVTDMYRFRPLVNQIQSEAEFWGDGPYPPRTIIEVDRLNQDDIVEVEGTFYAPCAKE
eukprot:scaffold1400_cov175-Amphora_coffeaeformis.AAC.15